jgi:hypothetical protein
MQLNTNKESDLFKYFDSIIIRYMELISISHHFHMYK